MLFNSPEFLFAFLPATLLFVLVATREIGPTAGILTLIVASLVFYGWWDPRALAVIGISITFNYSFARILSDPRVKRRLAVMWLGVSLNIAALAYFKYTNFFLTIVGRNPLSIVLPLAISFYSFQQIAFLVDIYNGRMTSPKFRDYLVSVLFFPHLIAGPLIHYTDIMRQFRERFGVTSKTIAIGFPIFCIGLAKKVGLADNLAAMATPLFKQAETSTLEFFSAWAAALTYTGQIYFDFSGYSDMAIGLALMFGITLPLNFDAPYKSTSIIEFWRRWHMTLSAFLRDYLYIPLGGSRLGAVRRYVNLLLVMLIGGLWHGAGWTFVFWGFLHGSYLCINHIWRSTVGELPGWIPLRMKSAIAWALTFLAVVVAWVFFRASSFQAAAHILMGVAGQSYMSLPVEYAYHLGISHLGPVPLDGQGLPFIEGSTAFALILVAYFLIFAFPSTADLFNLKAIGNACSPTASRAAIVIGLCLWISAFGVLGAAPSEFIYFQF